MSTRSEREWAMALQAMQGFGTTLHAAMEKKKKDKIANELMNQMDAPRAGYRGPGGSWVEPERPHRGGIDEYTLLQAQEQRDLDRKLKESQIHRNYRPSGRTGDPFAPLKFDLLRRNTESQIAERERKAQGGNSLADSPEKLDKDLRTAFGVGVDDLPDILSEGFTITNEKGEPDPNGGYRQFRTQAGETLTLPDEQIRPFARRLLKMQQGGFNGQQAYQNKLQSNSNVKPYVTPTQPKVTDESIPRVNSPEEARMLRPGTKFYDKDGILRVRP